MVTAMQGTVRRGQIDYYRHRATEYDATAYGDPAAAAARIAGVLAQVPRRSPPSSLAYDDNSQCPRAVCAGS
jgi:hypothetical protein